MMVSPGIQKIIIVIFVLVLLAFFGYQVFLTSYEAPVGEADLSGQEIVGQDILELVDKTEKVKIDVSIFTSDLFTNLVDYQIEIDPELQGRPNPFAPIGSDLANIR